MNIAVILAGGTGTRLGGDIPKQYIEVNGKTIIEYCLDKFMPSSDIDAIQIVADESWHGYINKCISNYNFASKFKGFSKPGQNRQLSILNALEDIWQYASKDDYVIIHDAARPCITKELISKCFETAKEHDGVLPVLPMKDTVYLIEDGKTISSLLNRSSLVAGQAPEVFRFGAYYDANKALLPDAILNINGSTEPAIMAGMDIAIIAGDEENFKVTTMQDLERFKQKLENV